MFLKQIYPTASKYLEYSTKTKQYIYILFFINWNKAGDFFLIKNRNVALVTNWNKIILTWSTKFKTEIKIIRNVK